MKKLLILFLFLLPQPVNSQMWKEYWSEVMEERTGVYEYSRDIDLQSIVKRGGYFYVNVRYWSDVPGCLLYTSPSPRDLSTSRMPSSA